MLIVVAYLLQEFSWGIMQRTTENTTNGVDGRMLLEEEEEEVKDDEQEKRAEEEVEDGADLLSSQEETHTASI